MSLSEKKEEFSILFDKYYRRLYRYAMKATGDEDITEELVQETFIKLWEHQDRINHLDRSIESYLVITLRHKIVDLHRKNQARIKHTNGYMQLRDTQIEIDNQWELSTQIENIYASLDSKIIEVFRLSREEGLPYKDIAKEKSLSIKTVELYISKALVAFREGLKDYLKKG